MESPDESEREAVFAAASPSLLVPPGKEKVVGIGGYHAVSAFPPLGGSAVTAAPEEGKETDAGIDGRSWRVSGVPPVAPPASAATGLVVVEGS